MILERISTLAVFVIAISTLLLLLSQNWRWSIVALALQYLAVFALILLVWPLGLAAVKLVAGWMAGAILGSSQPGPHLIEFAPIRSSAFLFRFFVAMLVWVLVISLTPVVVGLLPLPSSLVTGAMLLIGMGLVQLGISTRPLRVLLGLLTTLAGFELIYGAVERSVMVAGLLAVVTLGMAFIGAYLFETLPGKEGAE
ncbi:MAG: hypothetical protein IH586_10960 [Anaerolineaceae bacterium]|nr:hypothetical protein [Anaerolineaceae bacterium]